MLPDAHHSPSAVPPSSYYPRAQAIDVDALAAGVQRCIPPSNGYISLPPGCDPATVDFRTFCPYNPSEHKHRKRTTRPQLKILEDTFKRETKPNAQLRKALAAELDMSPRGVQVWFQNRRAKQKALAKKAQTSGNTPSLLNSADDQDGDRDEGGNSPPPSAISNDDADLPFSKSPEASPEPRRPSLSPLESTLPQNLPSITSDDLSPKRESGPSPTGLGLSRTSWHGPSKSVGETRRPTSTSTSTSSSASSTSQIEEEILVNLRRGSLPTDMASVPRAPPSAFRLRSNGGSMGGSVGPGGSVGFDPYSRRLSLDRLASHPYAHLAVAANGAVFGPIRASSQMHARARLPIGPKTQSPSQTPQAQRAPLPTVFTPAGHAHDHNHRSELMHRASMPTHAHGRIGSDPVAAAYRMRFPQDGHHYALSARTYQAPIPGPLPEPDFSFGTSTPSSCSSDSDSAGMSNFSRPRDGHDVDVETEDGSVASYDAFSSRFGSSRFGSIASVADSESSATSAYFSEVGSFEVRPPTSHSGAFDQDGRRLSCNAPFLDMFSSLDVENRSTSSLEPPAADHGGNNNRGTGEGQGGAATSTCPSPSSTVSGGSNNAIPISQSSELAYALQHVPDHQQSQDSDGAQDSADAGLTLDTHSHNIDSDTLSYTHSHGSGSSASLAYPLSAASSSSSSASLALSQQHLSLDIPEKFEFDSGIEVVSGTGHYSPVGEPHSSVFDYPELPVDVHMHPQHHHAMGGHPQYANMQHGGEDDCLKLHHAMEYSLHSNPAHIGINMDVGDSVTQYGYYN